jgi:tetratricopeptide (TPR) repeat protein/predicted membrane-bound spermidine synthase
LQSKAKCIILSSSIKEGKISMSKSRGFSPILIPSVTVFISSACIMVLELVAGRIIARHLGASLYTWTSVIGVVLMGITIGNYLGGRIADRFPAKKALASLLGISSAACVIVIILNNLVGEWFWLWKLSWPIHIFLHVSLVFILPSTLLGTISPVVAKMALDKGLPTGRTVGDIYAWGVAGSIIGTFLTGFYLIAAMGTIAIIWIVAAVLLLMAILYWHRLLVLYMWAVIFIVLMTMGMAPAKWAESAGSALWVRKPADPSILYETESQYCYIAVRQLSQKPDRRAFVEDKLLHSEIIMDDVLNLQYFYSRIYAALTHGLAKGKLSTMVIGGGGYAYPQYLEKRWPGSRIDVVEIDPAVTEAAIQAFGLDRNSSINTITMDARNYVDELLSRQRSGEEIPRYNFIYEDAFNDYSVPFQLVTREFNDKIAKILTDDGVYIINMIDTFDNGRFLGAVINTLEETFPYVHVVAAYATLSSERETYVIIVSKCYFEPESILTGYDKNLKLWYLSESDKNLLKGKSRGIVLTDDYVPVENLLTPVLCEGARENLASKYVEQAEKLRGQARWNQSIAKYKKAVQLRPAMTTKLYNEIGVIQGAQGNAWEAIRAFQNALNYHTQTGTKENIIGSIYLNLGLTFRAMGKNQEARENFTKAVEQFRIEITETPNPHPVYAQLGNALIMMGNFKAASDAYRQALALNPSELSYYYNLANALQNQNRIDEAINVLKEGVKFMSDNGQMEAATKLKKLLDLLEYQKSKQQK